MRIAVIQGGPMGPDLSANLEASIAMIDEAAKVSPDLVLLSELVIAPSFCFSTNSNYFDWAEKLNGKSVQEIKSQAKKNKFSIVYPFFEKTLEGTYYNSTVLIGRDGRIVEGRLPGGDTIRCYRKTHPPNVILHFGDRRVPYNEGFYFRPGPGLPVFELEDLTVGILICSDRIMPEAWRVLALQNAELILVPSAIPSWETAPGVKREELYISELRIRALENGIFVAAASKGGEEEFEGKKNMFLGASCIIDPFGTVLAKGSHQKGPELIWCDLSLGQIKEARNKLPIFMMRRPKLYSLISDEY
jgi:predicted amidohydrolase